jgi:hypothetical protein
VLAFTTPAQTIPAGAPSAAMSLALTTSSGLPVTTPAPLSVTLSSTSPQGTFSTSPAGPWSGTLSLTIAAGTGTTPAFYYQDTRAGSHQLTASAPGATSGTQTITVTPGTVAALTITPGSATVRARASQRFAVAGTDVFGNAAQVAAAWSLTPPTLGTIAPGTGASTAFTAGRILGTGTITAAVPSGTTRISAAADVTVAPGRLRIVSITYRKRKRYMLVTASAFDASGKSVSRARVYYLVRRDGRPHYSGRAVTGPAGRVVYHVPARRGGCFTTTIRRAAAAGFTWDGRSPRNRFCQRGP